MKITLSRDQKKASDKLIEFVKKPKQFITLGGYAGTGKTTLVSYLRNELENVNKNLSIAYIAYTGKASRVLSAKLKSSGTLKSSDSVSTIHSLIYAPITNSKNEIIGWERKPKINADLIILDEASMVDESIWSDLLTYQVPIIAIGDHGQLPPINGKFNLMAEPQIKLTQIHRQAEGNPIIKLSIIAREEGKIDPGFYGNGVLKVLKSSEESREIIGEVLSGFNKDTLVLCGYNTTRVKLNDYIRKGLGFETNEPTPGDRVICLRNNHEKEIYNGMTGIIKKIETLNDGNYFAQIEMDDDINCFKGEINSTQFRNTTSLNFTDERSNTLNTELYDFGYAVTVHKAQGSQAKRVVLFEERFKQMDDENWRRWLYTGVTRAEEELYIVG